MHIASWDLKITTDSLIRSVKDQNERFLSPINFSKCREEIAGALREVCFRWCEREHVESNALNTWKLVLI